MQVRAELQSPRLDKENFLVRVRSMAKVTSKLQITIPKSLAERFGIHPGDDIEWASAGDAIRIVPLGESKSTLSTAERIKLFDQATDRQRQRETESPRTRSGQGEERGWDREDLYSRGRPR